MQKTASRITSRGPVTFEDLIACANASFTHFFASALRDLNVANAHQAGQAALFKQHGMLKCMLKDFKGFVQDLDGRTDDAYWLSQLSAAKVNIKQE